ncbi:MAG TPA: antitoxin Xre-like helix-turn-helix domain-containing protein, partial [Terriglobales bacterium]|nr:antitoxin Xre-like helix-turn-helix domain-containing protein [Terriglobales bacterium]
MAAPRMGLDAISDWLGVAVGSDFEAAHTLAAGLPNAVVQRFLDRGLTRNEVFGLILPLRTWKHRKSRKEPLSAEESERAWRAARVLARARQVLGGPDAALAWMRAPKRRFQGQ